jgi:hypothetical protein
MCNLKKSLIALFVMLTLYGVEARAESFVITDVQGSAFVSTYTTWGPLNLSIRPSFKLFGPGLSMVTSVPPTSGGDPGNVEARDACIVFACSPGMVIGTNSSFSGIIAPTEATRATVNGVRYDFVKLTGALDFISSPILIRNTGVNFDVKIPFTFSGELTGDAIVFLQPVVNPIFTSTLSGHGQATFHFLDVTFGTAEVPMYRLAFVEYRFEPLSILIDIKPATSPNSINQKSKGKIPVAILTTDSFDAASVDPTTVLFGATGNEVAPVHFAMEDIDGDGDTDLVLHFVTQETGITCANGFASLTGETFSGVTIKGFDAIETVGCN